MYLKTSQIANIIPDNDFTYFSLLEGVVNSVDNSSLVEILRKPHAYTTRISPSEDKKINIIIEEILKLHTLLGIHIDMSKSIKVSGKIFYNISL